MVSAKENISEGPEGIILEAMLEGMAEYYSAELAVKIKRGQTENALKCRYNGGFVPFGYRVNEDKLFEIDPLTAPIVREIFERYADGQTVGEISEALNDRGVFTNSKYKYTNKSSMHNLLKNRRYLGEYRHGEHIVTDGMPAIVTQDIFDKVQARMAKNKHAPASAKAPDEFILTTKLFCGHDGVFMVGTSGTSKTGKVHHYYKCGNAIYKKSCSKKAVRKDYIERYVVDKTKELVLNDATINRFADKLVALRKQGNTVLPVLQKQLDDVDKAIANLLDAIQQGLFNVSAKQRLDDLESRKMDLEISLAKERIEKSMLTHEQVVHFMSRFKDGDIDNPEYRKNVIDCFVNSVYLYDDKIVLNYNSEDGTKTVTYSEILSSDLDDSAPPNKLPSNDTMKSIA